MLRSDRSAPRRAGRRRRPVAGVVVLVPFVLLWLSAAAPGPAARATQAAQVDQVGAAPSRPALVRGFVEAFNSGDPAVLVAFLRDHATPRWLAKRPEADRMELFGRMMKDLGHLEVHAVESEGDDRVVVHAAAEGVDDPVRIELFFGPSPKPSSDREPSSPVRIAGLGIDVAPAPPSDLPELPPLSAGSAGDTLSDESRAALDHYFRDLADADRFAGTVLLAIDGQPVFEGAYGPADRDWQIPNRMSTRFDLGSINKELTKVAVGQLLAAGQLSLNDTILDLLPDYPNPDTGGRITVAQLLDHTSGLGDIFGPAFFRMNKALLRTNRDYFPLFADQPLLFEPGTDRHYSNAGYVVLGAIVARVSGEPYAEYVTHHVFEPAGMSGAAFAARDRIQHDVAVGYTRQGGGDLRPNTFMLPVVGMGAGSAVATAADLLAFDRALREHRLLEPRYTTWLFTGTLPPAAEAGEDAAPAGYAVGVAGGAPGVNAILEGDGRHTAILLSNVDPPTAESLGVELASRLEALAPSGDGTAESVRRR